MSAIETLRAILVGTAAVAAVIAAVLGLWFAAVVLSAAIGVHGFATYYLRQLRVAPPPAPPGDPAA